METGLIIFRVILIAAFTFFFIRPDKEKRNWVHLILITTGEFLYLYLTDSYSEEHFWMKWIINPIAVIIIFIILNTLGAIITSPFVINNRIKNNRKNLADALFNHVNSSIRSSQLELIIASRVIAYDEDPNEIIQRLKTDIKIVPNNKKPAYYLALGYTYLYLLNNKDKSLKCCESCLALVDCYYRDHLFLDMYKWMGREPRVSNVLFKPEGDGEVYRKPLVTEVEDL